MFELTDRDYASYALPDIDLEAQLLAVRSLLSRNRTADEALIEEISRLGKQAQAATGPNSWHLVDHHVDLLHGSVYHDAANSMSAVGMLAPMIESVFVGLFRSIGRQGWPLNSHKRSKRAGEGHEAFWNPQIYFPKPPETHRTDLTLGIPQLVEATGMEAAMAPDYKAVLKALFVYRNRMFHNGFEWPKATRAEFASLIETEGWPDDWFSRATSGGEPWVFYMSELLIERCFEVLDKALDGAGRHIRELSRELGWKEEVIKTAPETKTE
ncbi:hypothetical protein ACETK8_10085 [Brevundimonas staleyi]|uniref:Uncharacterized protein n=1 Tax=Brevundimonas staleyi TaxID=74326 RepID=A0ABW0FP76_9CAUL